MYNGGMNGNNEEEMIIVILVISDKADYSADDDGYLTNGNSDNDNYRYHY